MARLFTILILVLSTPANAGSRYRKDPPFLVVSEELYCPKCEYETEVALRSKQLSRAIELVIQDFVDNKDSSCGVGDRIRVREHSTVSIFAPKGVTIPKARGVKRGKAGIYSGTPGQIMFSASGFREDRLRLKNKVGVWVNCQWKEGDASWSTAYALVRMRSGQYVAFPQIVSSIVGGRQEDPLVDP